MNNKITKDQILKAKDLLRRERSITKPPYDRKGTNMRTVTYQGRDYFVTGSIYKMVDNKEITILEAIQLMEDTL